MTVQRVDFEAHCVRLRSQFGLRSDLAWVREVAITGDSGGMVLGIPLTPAERADIEDRRDRVLPVLATLHEAALVSDAGCWIDQEAGGLLHVLLADPGPAELRTARALIAGIPAVIDIVATPMSELERLKDQVSELHRNDSKLRAAMIQWGVDVRANRVAVTLKIGADPTVAERLLRATDETNVAVEFSAMRWVAG